MNTRIGAALLAAFFWSGLTNCANVKDIDFLKADKQMISDMNASMGNKAVVVKSGNGDSSSGRFEAIRNGSLHFSPKAGPKDSLKFADISSIRYRNNALGAATYGVLGFIAALYIWSETPEGPGWKVGQGILHWSIVLPIGTGLIGYKAGRTEVYRNKKQAGG